MKEVSLSSASCVFVQKYHIRDRAAADFLSYAAACRMSPLTEENGGNLMSV